MSNATRPERDELRQLSTAGPRGLVGQAAAGAGTDGRARTPFAHDFAVIRERARDWRARTEASGGGPGEPCEGMGV